MISKVKAQIDGYNIRPVCVKDVKDLRYLYSSENIMSSVPIKRFSRLHTIRSVFRNYMYHVAYDSCNNVIGIISAYKSRKGFIQLNMLFDTTYSNIEKALHSVLDITCTTIGLHNDCPIICSCSLTSKLNNVLIDNGFKMCTKCKQNIFYMLKPNY